MKKEMEILLVEDENLARESLLEDLEGEGYVVDAAINGKEALEKFREKKFYPVVVLDLKMPVMSGNDFLKTLRTDFSQHCKVIVLTGHGDLEDAIDSVNYHAYAYLKKEVIARDMNLLFDKIKEAFDALTAPTIDELRQLNQDISPDELEKYFQEGR